MPTRNISPDIEEVNDDVELQDSQRDQSLASKPVGTKLVTSMASGSGAFGAFTHSEQPVFDQVASTTAEYPAWKTSSTESEGDSTLLPHSPDPYSEQNPLHALSPMLGMSGAISSGTKRTFGMHMDMSPSVSPKKKEERRVEVQSAIHTAIAHAKDTPHGLMKYFKQCSKEEYNEQVWRHTTEENKFAQERKEIEDAAHRCHVEKARKGACERQQRHRQIIRDNEIADGKWLPDGTKCSQKVSNILDCII
jgi:hypothetical protein